MRRIMPLLLALWPVLVASAQGPPVAQPPPMVQPPSWDTIRRVEMRGGLRLFWDVGGGAAVHFRKAP